LAKKEFEKEFGKINIYPNPVTDILNVKIDSNKKQLHFIITDITGRETKSGELVNGINSIKTQSIRSKGIYFVTISDGRSTFSQKIVKK
jgi:hypothetical protein